MDRKEERKKRWAFIVFSVIIFEAVLVEASANFYFVFVGFEGFIV